MSKMINKEILIDLVRNEPALWDHRIKAYHNRDAKPDIWDGIGQELHTSGKQAQKVWEQIRDSYRKKKKKISQGIAKEPIWPHFNSLSFLDEVFSFRGHSGNIALDTFQTVDNESQQMCEETFEMVDGDDISIDDSEDVDFTTGRKRSTPAYFQSHNKRYRIAEEETLAVEKQKAELLELRLKKKSLENDEDYLFVMSLLPSMKSLSCIEKMKLRIAIMRCVADALENHESHTCGSSSQNFNQQILENAEILRETLLNTQDSSTLPTDSEFINIKTE